MNEEKAQELSEFTRDILYKVTDIVSDNLKEKTIIELVTVCAVLTSLSQTLEEDIRKLSDETMIKFKNELTTEIGKHYTHVIDVEKIK